MRLKSSEVTAGLKSIETSVGNLIKMVKEFGKEFSNSLASASTQATSLLNAATQIAAVAKNISPLNAVGRDQVDAADNLQMAVDDISKMSPTITAETLKQFNNYRKQLDTAVQIGLELEKQGKAVVGMGKGTTKQSQANQSMNKFISEMNETTIDQWDLVKKLSANNLKDLTIDKHRSKIMKEYVKNLESMLKTDKSLLTNMHISVDEAQNIVKNWDNLDQKVTKTTSSVEKLADILLRLGRVIPGIAVLFATFENPISLIGNELNRIHDLWKENNTAANNFLKNGKDLGVSLYDTLVDISSAGGSMSKELSAAGYTSANTLMTLDQAQAGLNATLQSSHKNIVANTGELKLYAVMATQTAQATGIATTELADLSLQMRAMHKSTTGETDELKLFNEALADSSMLMNSLVNISAEYKLTNKEMSVVTGHLQKNMSGLNSAYKTMRTTTGQLIPPAVQYTAVMAAMGSMANKAGQSGVEAMNSLANAIENPLDNIILLGKSAFSKDVGEQMTAVGESALKAQKMMAGKSLAVQQIIAGIYGKSVSEINSLAAAQQGLKDKYKDVAPEQRALKIAAEMADQTKANEARTAASADAANRLTSALDKLSIIFGRIAQALQPLMDGLAWLVNLPLAPYFIVATAAIIAFFAAFAGAKLLWNVNKGMKALAESSKSIAKAQTSGAASGGLKGFAEGFVGAINAFKTVNWASMIKAAGMIALVGIALAVGIGAIGLALGLMPPGKIAEFLVVTTGLVAATAVMSMLGAVGPTALVGALLLAAVGAGLAAGIALIGLSMQLMPPNSVEAFIALTAGLVLATGIMAGIALVAPLALVGAGLLLATGVALAAALAVIGLAFMAFDPITIADGISAIGNSVSAISINSGAALISLAAGLVAFSAAMAGGAIMSFFSGGIVENATRMGQALTQLVDPIAKLGSLGSTVGASFTQIADGLDRFTAVLDKGGGLFGTNFKARATELAASLQTMVGPIAELNKAQQGAMDQRAQDVAKVQAEEIKNALAVTIDQATSKDDASIKILNEIKDSIDRLVAVQERSSDMGQDLKSIVKNTKAMLDEMAMGGGMGGTSANHQYG